MKTFRIILSTVLIVAIVASMTVGFAGTATAASYNKSFEAETATLATNTNASKPFVTKMTSTTQLKLGSMTYTLTSGYSGTGAVALTNGPAQTLDLVTFKVSITTAGYYDITFRSTDVYGSEVRKNALFIGGEYWDYFYSGTDTYADSTLKEVYLKAGTNTLSVRKSATCDGNIYLDKITIKNSAVSSSNFYDVEPVLSNPKSNTKTKRLFSYLCDIYGQKTLTGQFAESSTAREIKAIQSATGQTPAMIGFDLMNYTSCYAHYLPSNVSKLKTTQNIIDWVNEEGGIATVTWHWYAPVQYIKDDKWTSSFRTGSLYTKATADHPVYFNLRNIMFGEDETGYNALIKDIDMIAAQLKILQNNGVTVLWRPLHEAGGNETASPWFWWGQDREAYIQLWKLVYDRLTDVHGLNNLIWVWNGQNPDWYPGDNYCDIIGWDVYPEAFDYTASSNRFWQSTAYPKTYNKIVTLSENGTMPSIDEMVSNNTMWSYFCTWSGEYVINSSSTFAENYTSKTELNKLYNHTKTVTLSELPSNLYTSYPIGTTSYTLTKTSAEKYQSPYGDTPVVPDEPTTDTDTEIPTTPITENVFTAKIAHDGDYETVVIDLLKVCPALKNPSSWTNGVEVSFTFEVDGLVEVVAGKGIGCGANGNLYVKYGTGNTLKQKNKWSYDVNWMEGRNLEANTVALTVDAATSPINEAGLKIYNFQQNIDGDLDKVVDGKNITVTIKSLKIGGVEQVDPNAGSDTTNRKYGDINNDGKINITDVVLLRAHIVGTKKLTGDDFTYADVNLDGKTNIVDVVMIRSTIVNG